MDHKTHQDHIAEEAFMIEHSGEIPEVALHSSLYYLTEDPDGPALRLKEAEKDRLKLAVVARYRAMIERDLMPVNRNKGFYRGLARCSLNWQRLIKFCAGENINIKSLRTETAGALQDFLRQELADVKSGKCSSSINCAAQDIEKLAGSLGIIIDNLPHGWRALCPGEKFSEGID